MRWPWSSLALVAAIAAVQANLWFARDNMPQVRALGAQLADQLTANQAARARNEHASADLADLQEGLEMVEEKARAELGMLRPDEILVQYTRRTGSSTSPSPEAAGSSPSSPRP